MDFQDPPLSPALSCTTKDPSTHINQISWAPRLVMTVISSSTDKFSWTHFGPVSLHQKTNSHVITWYTIGPHPSEQTAPFCSPGWLILILHPDTLFMGGSLLDAPHWASYQSLANQQCQDQVTRRPGLSLRPFDRLFKTLLTGHSQWALLPNWKVSGSKLTPIKFYSSPSLIPSGWEPGYRTPRATWILGLWITCSSSSSWLSSTLPR